MTSQEWMRDWRMVNALRKLRQVMGWIADDAEQFMADPTNEWNAKWLRGTIARVRVEAASAELDALLTTGPVADTVTSGKSEGKQDV